MVRVLAHVSLALGLTSGLTSGASAQGLDTLRLSPATGTASRGFTRPIDVRELSDGTVLITDAREERIYSVRFDGTVAEVGRQGRGPAEYQRPYWLFPVGADSSLVIDAGTGDWLLLYGTEIRNKMTRARHDLPEFLQVRGASRDGAVLMLRGASWTEDAIPGALETAASIDLLEVAIRRQGNSPPVVQERLVGQMSGAGAGGVGGCAVTAGAAAAGVRLCGDVIPIQDEAIITSDGWIAVVSPEPYRVTWRSRSGEVREGPVIDIDRPRLRGAELCAVIDRWSPASDPGCSRSEVEGRTIPDRYVPFLRWGARQRGVHRAGRPLLAEPGPAGRLFVRRLPTASSLDVNTYDVFDRDGRRVAVLSMPYDRALIGFGAGTIYSVQQDEFGLSLLHRHTWSDGG